MGEVGGVVAGHIGVIIVQIGADGFAVHPFKIVIGFSVRRNDQIKIAGAHAQGLEVLMHHCIRSGETICRQNRGKLTTAGSHDFDPADVLFGGLVENDVGSVHTGAVIKWGFGIVADGDNHTQILPVVKVGGFIHPDTVVPGFVLTVGVFLVFAVPVVFIVHSDDGTSVGLNAFAIGIQPYLAGIKTIVHGSLLPEPGSVFLILQSQYSINSAAFQAIFRVAKDGRLC